MTTNTRTKVGNKKRIVKEHELHKVATYLGKLLNTSFCLRRSFVNAVKSMPELRHIKDAPRADRMTAYGKTFFKTWFSIEEEGRVLNIKPARSPNRIADLYCKSMETSGKWHAYLRDEHDAAQMLYAFFLPPIQTSMIASLCTDIVTVVFHRVEKEELDLALSRMEYTLQKEKKRGLQVLCEDKREYRKRLKA